MSIMLFLPLEFPVKGTRYDWEPPVGCPSSHCLLHGPDQPPQDAPGQSPEDRFCLAVEPPIYPTTHSQVYRGFIISIRDTCANLVTTSWGG